jgi:hypothetical protein
VYKRQTGSSITAASKGKALKTGGTAGNLDLISAATDDVKGVVDEVDEQTSRQTFVPAGCGAVCKVRLGGTVAKFARLKPNADAEFVTEGTGNRRVQFVALEAGVDGDLIDAICVVPPARIGAAVTDTSTNGAASSAADLAALKTETEALGDSFRALLTSLRDAAIIDT